MTNRRGFTLVELVIAMVLFGIVGTALYQLLVNNQRLYQEQTQRVQVNESARAAISLLPGEVRELNAADTAGSDIVSMTPSSLTYKAMRGLYVLCQAPNTGALQVTVDNTLFYGLRRVDPTQDSVLMFMENDPDTRTDDAWLHANVTSAVLGTACPGGTASLTLQLSGVSSGQLAGVTAGAPVRTFELAQVLVYADAAGDQWLGGRLYLKSAGTWSGTQPIVGPLSATGLQLAYYDAAGGVTATAASVARVGITVQSRSARAVTRTPTGFDYLLQNLMTHVALRNNPN
jgi:prepilin-type N-terminal cleavage/methylation domain-containing protein